MPAIRPVTARGADVPQRGSAPLPTAAAPSPGPAREAARPAFARRHAFLFLAIALAVLGGLLWATTEATRAADLPPLTGAAVFPFADRRQPDRQDWLGAFLRSGIEDALLRSGRVPLVGDDVARIWATRYGPLPEQAAGRHLTPQRLREAGLAFIVRGATQRVVNQALVMIELVAQPGEAPDAGEPPQLEILPARPPGSSESPATGPGSTHWELRVDLASESPEQALNRVLGPLFEAMGLDVPPAPPPQPASWEAAQGYYGTLVAIVPGRPAEVASERDLRLAQAQRDPALRPKALTRLAQVRLEQARMELTDESRRTAALREALRMLSEAIALDAWDPRRMALKAEIHYFLKEDYEARTEASVARLRNPRDGLAFAVLALVAGLSTAEGTEWMKQALAADPYLKAAARPAGWPPFQRGALQPFIERWEELSQKADAFADPEFERQIALGRALFESRQWEDASEAFAAAQEMQTDSHLPRLYLARIRMESGDAAGATEELRVLAGEYPQESEVWYAYGLALEAGEQFADAEDALRHALEERPDEPNALYHLALAQMARERWEEARSTLKILTERNSRHGQAWLLLGTTELQLANWREAHSAFRQALQLDPASEKARAGMRLAVEKAKSAQGQQP